MVGNYYTGEIFIMQGNGTANFGIVQTYTTGIGTNQILIKDLNADGKPDLVVNCHAGYANVLLGNGNMTFSSPSAFLASAPATNLVLADFNNDGKDDLASTGNYNNDVVVLLGNGSGGFPTTYSFTTNTNPSYVTSGDFDFDGNQDLVVSFMYRDSIAIYRGNGMGAFGPPNYYTDSAWQNSVLPADFDLDGKIDLAITCEQIDVSILLNCAMVGIGEFNEGSKLSLYPNPGNEKIHVESEKLIERLKVSNSLGQTVFEETPNASGYSFQLDAPGVYFITIYSGQSIITKKVIVN